MTIPQILSEAGRGIVYVKPVAVAELPDEVRAEVQAQSAGLATVYSVNSPDGMRLALVANRKLAFDLARQHEMDPVNVH